MRKHGDERRGVWPQELISYKPKDSDYGHQKDAKGKVVGKYATDPNADEDGYFGFDKTSMSAINAIKQTPEYIGKGA